MKDQNVIINRPVAMKVASNVLLISYINCTAEALELAYDTTDVTKIESHMIDLFLMECQIREGYERICSRHVAVTQKHKDEIMLGLLSDAMSKLA